MSSEQVAGQKEALLKYFSSLNVNLDLVIFNQDEVTAYLA